MLYKFKTEVASIAFKARSGMPADYTRTVEADLQNLIHLYSALFTQGKRALLMEAVSMAALSCMAEIVASLPPEVAASLAQAQGAQSTKCKHCGGAHRSEDH